MGYLANVVANTPILATWGNTIRDQTVMPFATVAERTSQWATPPIGAVSHIATTPGVLYVYAGATLGWVPGGGGPVYRQYKRTVGDQALNTSGYANWADMTSDWQITIPARAGDLLQVTFDARWNTAAGGSPLLDCYCFQSGVAIGSSVGASATGVGIASWGGHALVGTDPVGGSAFRVLAAGDINAGNLLLKMRARVTGGVTQIIEASALVPATWNAINWGPSQ